MTLYKIYKNSLPRVCMYCGSLSPPRLAPPLPPTPPPVYTCLDFIFPVTNDRFMAPLIAGHWRRALGPPDSCASEQRANRPGCKRTFTRAAETRQNSFPNYLLLYFSNERETTNLKCRACL